VFTGLGVWKIKKKSKKTRNAVQKKKKRDGCNTTGRPNSYYRDLLSLRYDHFAENMHIAEGEGMQAQQLTVLS